MKRQPEETFHRQPVESFFYRALFTKIVVIAQTLSVCCRMGGTIIRICYMKSNPGAEPDHLKIKNLPPNRKQAHLYFLLSLYLNVINKNRKKLSNNVLPPTI
jgi:hypothetical protein